MNAQARAETDVEPLSAIIHFLEDWSQSKHVELSFFSDSAKFHSPDLLTLPAAVGDAVVGAWERSQLLQEAEEAWNYQEPAPLQQILLVPTRPRKSTSSRKVKGKKNHAIQ